jgi:hypothetical protein
MTRAQARGKSNGIGRINLDAFPPRTRLRSHAMLQTNLRKSQTITPVIAMLLAGLAAGAAGCSGEAGGPLEEINEAGMSFEEFEATVYQEPDTGIYIVDGDTPIVDREALIDFYVNYVQDGALIIHKAGKSVAKWTDQQKLNISYCVNKTGFGGSYSAAVSAMTAAAGAWESAANVNFVHLTQYDTACSSGQKNVVFDVQLVNSGGQYLARAFFPNQSRTSRNVYIDVSAVGSSNPDLTGVLRHELGHALGFRHEHTRPESGVCFEDTNWQVLTSYDKSSVMHYPQCNGINSWALTLSSLDKSGAASVYGAP